MIRNSKTLSMIKAMYGIRLVDLLRVALSQSQAERFGGESIDLISVRKKSPRICNSLVFLSASYLFKRTVHIPVQRGTNTF